MGCATAGLGFKLVDCEEHLTVDLHLIVPALCKALQRAQREGEREHAEQLLICVELLGRFVLPAAYLPFDDLVDLRLLRADGAGGSFDLTVTARAARKECDKDKDGGEEEESRHN